MKLLYKNHIPIANKLLILFSGLNDNAIDHNGKKIYEQQKFNIKKGWKIKWTKSLVKQMLAYLALTNSSGSIGVISVSELSKDINVCAKTIKNNNRTLEETGLIEIKGLRTGLFWVGFKNYKEDCLDLFSSYAKGCATVSEPEFLAEENQNMYFSHTGYTTIKDVTLLELFAISNINELRMACRSLYIFEKEVNVAKNDCAIITYNDFKGILPTYYAYKKNIKKGFQKIKTIFSHTSLENNHIENVLLDSHKVTPSLLQKLTSPFVITFSLHDRCNSKYIVQKEFDEIYHVFESFTYLICNKSLKNAQIRSLVMEFGNKMLFDGINEMSSIFKGGYCKKRSEFIDGIDSNLILTIRTFMINHQRNKLVM